VTERDECCPAFSWVALHQCFELGYLKAVWNWHAVQDFWPGFHCRRSRQYDFREERLTSSSTRVSLGRPEPPRALGTITSLEVSHGTV
jgi:hypothetical protein